MDKSTTILIPEELFITTLDNPVFSSLSIHITGWYIKEFGHFIERDGINECILIYCIDGKGWLKKDNKIYEVNKGDIVFCDKYAPHSYGANDQAPWSILWVHFCGQYTDYFASQLNLKDSCGVESIGYQPQLVEYFEKILHALNKGNNILNLIESATYLQLLLCFILKEKRFTKENEKPSNSYIEKAISYMKENTDKKFSLDELAYVAQMSKYHFTRCFKKATDYSPTKFRNLINNKF